MDNNLKAFLKLITFLEANWKGVNPYYLYYGNKYKITTLKDHPIATREANYVPVGNNKTSASGAYQIVFKTYSEFKKNKIVKDFSEASQDKIAVELIKRRGAYQSVIDGYIVEAITLCRNEWEAFDKVLNKNYKYNLNDCINKFIEFGGVAMIKQPDGSYQATTLNINSQTVKKKSKMEMLHKILNWLKAKWWVVLLVLGLGWLIKSMFFSKKTYKNR